MAAFVLATVAMRAGHNDDAIAMLREYPQGGPYEPFHNCQYLLGLAKLRRLDPDANQALEGFLNRFQGENGVKDGYQKLAWYHLVNGNEAGYKTYMRYLALKGSDNSEPDKSAARESKSGETPNPVLLQARLLFDGGYYDRALQVLAGAGYLASGDRKQQIEYHYRLGRICQKMGKTADAIHYYSKTIELGAREPWYFACGAALQLGILYEEKKDVVHARLAFRRCLAIKPEEYAGSLHAQAKAGLGRVR
jgi:tetratricopeptide (TPR) repeat protein